MKTSLLFLIILFAPLLSLAQTGSNKTNDTSKATKKIGLNEVTIKSKRPLIQTEIDKTVVNVAAMLSSASSNTLEVLEKTPGVTVNAGGEISLNGRAGVLVLIDGRQTYLSAADLANYLKSIPGGNLDKIELMDNPPARYDAAGNGVINIRLKKNRQSGFTGSLSSGYAQGKLPRNNNSLNLNYNYNKLNIFSNLGYSYDKNYSDDVYNRSFFNTDGNVTNRLLLNNYQQNKGKGINTNIGMDYAPTKSTTYGMQVSYNHSTRYNVLNSGNINYGITIPDSTGNSYTDARDSRDNLNTNLNFYHRFGETGREITADANYLRYTADGEQNLQNLVYLPDGALKHSDNFLYSLPSTMNIYTAKADYVHPLKNKAKLEAGIKWSWVSNDNPSDYYQLVNGEQIIDNGRSNHFKYREDFTAAYITGQKAWKRIGIQAGLRAEHTSANGLQLGNEAGGASAFNKDYTQVFPSVFINYKLDTISKNSLSFIVTRRINRPNYQLLNPFLFYRDQYSYSLGNPELNPQYQYRYELKYQHGQTFRTGLSYNRFTNVIFQTTNVVEGRFITKPENVSEGYILLFNSGLNISPAKWWTFNTDVLLSRMGLNGQAYGEKLNPATFAARINVLNQLQFGKGWSAELGGYYSSRDLNGQTFTSAMVRANAGLQKKIWKDKGSIRLVMEDIFHSWKYRNNSVALKQAYYYQTGESDTRRFGIAFTYNFGSDTFARKSKHKDNALDEEKGRM
ncbi:outer membrane beta-barrel family protein [Mucilaginibacter gynuensis]|uniref:Outer membrane beta-barrel family protein n=1 Tax=Mucilaginibacter gynuensis TaxID=1302236 RepID=A0ABP8G3G8_9SPHI